MHVSVADLLNQPSYKAQVSQFMCPSSAIPILDNLNLQEERPMVVFGPHEEEQDPSPPPFYVTLVVLGLLLHNCVLDSGALHNLMSLSVMEKLGL